MEKIGNQENNVEVYKDRLVVGISGAGASGKGSIIEGLLGTEGLGLQKVVRHTTRLQGEHELEGDSYHFVDEELFLTMIERGELIEYQKYKPGYYGTSIQSVLNVMNAGQTPLLDLDPNASAKLRELLENRGVNYLELFLSPVSAIELAQEGGIDKALKILRDRMVRRYRQSDLQDGVIEGRMRQARQWFADIHQNVRVIHNSEGGLAQAIAESRALITYALYSDDNDYLLEP